MERARGAGNAPISLDIAILGPINRVERAEVVGELSVLGDPIQASQ